MPPTYLSDAKASIQPMTALSIEKAKVGPITARYQNGEFVTVESDDDGIEKYAVLGLDNSHSKDYKVSYASDALLVLNLPDDPDAKHHEVKSVLKDYGLWKNEYVPIWIPDPAGGWMAAYKSLPKSARSYERFRDKAATLVENEHDMFEGENGFRAHL